MMGFLKNRWYRVDTSYMSFYRNVYQVREINDVFEKASRGTFPMSDSTAERLHDQLRECSIKLSELAEKHTELIHSLTWFERLIVSRFDRQLRHVRECLFECRKVVYYIDAYRSSNSHG